MNRHEIALKKLAEGTVIPATPLALNENRIFNEEGQRLLMKYYLNSGAGGIATAVHTTQFEIRYPEYNLYEPVLKIVSEEIDKFEQEHNTVVIKVAGVCGPVEQALGEVEIAKKYGYDAVLLSVGGLDSLTEDELIERTKLVAKEIPVIGFYLQPSAGGRLLSYDYWQKLCAIENVVAIKSAPFNRYQTMDVVRAVAMSDRCDDITLYTGNDDNIVVDLLTKYKFTKNGKTVVKSFEGGLLGHWCVWTKKVVEMFAEIKEAMMSTTRTKIGALLAKPAFTDLKKKLDYTEYGGSLLLGTKAGLIKSHGSSNAKAIVSAIRQGREFAQMGVVAKIQEELAILNEKTVQAE